MLEVVEELETDPVALVEEKVEGLVITLMEKSEGLVERKVADIRMGKVKIVRLIIQAEEELDYMEENLVIKELLAEEDQDILDLQLQHMAGKRTITPLHKEEEVAMEVRP